MLNLLTIFLLTMLCDSLKTNTDSNLTIYRYHHTKEGFRNENLAITQPGFKVMYPFIIQKLWDNITVNKFDLPRVINDGELLRNNREEPTITWIGHSTLLVQLDGVNILTDPVWSNSVGPGTPFDSPRMNQPGIKLDQLPNIDFVLLSHDHYDHLDRETIEHLAQNESTLFVVPLRVKKILEDWEVKNEIVELDWWDSTEYKGIKIVCTPAQHFSGRGLSRNTTLWASFCVMGKTKRFYYGGDSGYWKHFAQIGKEHGPFDLVAIPIGAYIPKEIMKYMHLDPVQAVDAYMDLRGKYFVPIHYGTFPLSYEPYDEPTKLLLGTIKKKNFNEKYIWILKLGETKGW